MKKTLLVILVSASLGCKFGNEEGEKMPAFEILMADGNTRLNTIHIKEGSPVALLYFSPDCEHCQAETEGIIHHMDSLKNVNFVFVTNDNFGQMIKFKNYYHLDIYPNISIGRDDQFFMIRHFKGIIPPSLVLYDKNKRQKKIFSGQTPASDLIAEICHL